MVVMKDMRCTGAMWNDVVKKHVLHSHVQP